MRKENKEKLSSQFSILIYVVYICPDIIFQVLPPCSRPMMSHHVTCHVTAMSCAFSSSKNKIKEKKNKKLLVFKCSITSGLPISLPEQQYRTKSNLTRYNNYCTFLQLSFLAIIKYSRFLQSIQIFTEFSATFIKNYYSSKAQIIANIFCHGSHSYT